MRNKINFVILILFIIFAPLYVTPMINKITIHSISNKHPVIGLDVKHPTLIGDVININNMKEIKLTKGQIALVDDEDFDYINQWKWRALKNKDGTYYAVRGQWIDRKKVCILMHRLLMKTPSNMVCDHIFHNTLDNRKSKLRNCTRRQNQRNCCSKINSSSKYLGVSKLCVRYKKKEGYNMYWQSQITINNKNHGIGTFPYTVEGEILAAKRYNEMAIKHYGEFANINIIPN